jgi:hypothetical protein
MRAQTWSWARMRAQRWSAEAKWPHGKGAKGQIRRKKGRTRRGGGGWRQIGERDADAKGAGGPLPPMAIPPLLDPEHQARCGLRPAGHFVPRRIAARSFDHGLRDAAHRSTRGYTPSPRWGEGRQENAEGRREAEERGERRRRCDRAVRCGLGPAGRVGVGHRDRRADLGGTSAACSWCHQPVDAQLPKYSIRTTVTIDAAVRQLVRIVQLQCSWARGHVVLGVEQLHA